MNLGQYRKEVQRTAEHPTLSGNDLVVNFAACLIEEVGEVTGVVKKHLWHGHELDRSKLVKELGDLLWYVIALANLKNVSTDRIILIACDETKEHNLLVLQDLVNQLKYSIVRVDINGYEFGYDYAAFFHQTIEQIDNFAFLFNITMSEIMQVNIDKLKARYPDKFTFEDSKNRK